mmetsp:Transcript_9782/g.44571  ORF Transcript_9782/g.44571 Transcript_9782/m.44571 type:complete len:130 (-) Transcript_9782:1031-1420(-)
MSDRYKSRGRKERTPEQLKVLEMAREKARLVIAERTKIKREMAEPPPEPDETEPPTPPPEPEPLAVEDSAPTPPPKPEPPAPPPEPEPPAELPAEDSLTREEIQTLIHSTLNPPERKYQYINGAYVKIK